MTTINGSTSSTSGSTAPATASSAAASAQAAAAAALQTAAASIIGQATGDTSLDASTLVSALVTSKVAGQTAQLSENEATDNAEISAFGQLQSSLASLQSAIEPLYDGAMLTSFSATMSGTGITASAGVNAVAGSYSVDVTQIASAESLTSNQFTSEAADSVGTGSMTVSVGSKSMTLNVTSSNDSLSDIASAINSADDNPGVTASVLTGTNGQYLVLSADATGAANTISITTSADSSTGLQSLDYSSSSTPGSSIWTQTSAAQNAELTVNGVSASSASNTVTTVINGVTLNLTSASVDKSTDGSGAQTLTVSADTSAEAGEISNFVTAYNSLVSTISSLTAYNPTASSTSSSSSTTGPLIGNPLVNSLKNALGNIVASSVSSGGTTGTLASLGITLNNDGTLSLDTTTLDSAVVSDPATVQAVFNLTTGIGAQLNNTITPYTEPDGQIDTSLNALTSDLDNLTTQTNNLTAYSNELTSQYTAEFTALDSLMTSTNNDEQYLTDLFGNANNAGSLSGSSS